MKLASPWLAKPPATEQHDAGSEKATLVICLDYFKTSWPIFAIG